MKYEINGHTIEFTRAAMTAAHQAFPLEFAEWNLALKLKGKATLPGVTVAEIEKHCMTEADKGPAVTREQVCSNLAPASPEPRPVAASAAGLKVFAGADAACPRFAIATGGESVFCNAEGWGESIVGIGYYSILGGRYYRPATEAEAAEAFKSAWASDIGRKWLTERGWKPEGK